MTCELTAQMKLWRPVCFVQICSKMSSPEKSLPVTEERRHKSCHKPAGGAVFASAKDRWLRNASVKNQGDNHENRSDRRQWIHRVKARTQVARARPRSNRSIPQFRRKHPHGRGTGRSVEKCLGSR